MAEQEQTWLSGDDATLEDAVASANVPTLMMVLAHLTEDAAAIVRGPIRPKRASPQRPDGGLSEAEESAIKQRALQVLRAFRDRGVALPPLPPREVLAEMMSFSLGQPVAPEYVPMMLQDMGLAGEPARSRTQPIAEDGGIAPALRGGAMSMDFEVLVIGAGMSGLLAAIKLKEAGVRFSIVEKNAEVGGTWFENSYPGCRVDLPSHFYSLSFEPNHDWSHHFALRDELRAYFERLCRDHGVRDAIRFESEVVAADYDDQTCRWTVRLREPHGRERTVHANALISAVGQLNRPSTPELPGLSSFAGPAFHTARFRHDVELAGKRVAVIGCGASSMQIVPRLAETAEKLVVFQRSPQWALRHPDYFRPVSAGKRWLLRNVPYYAPWYRFRLFFTHGDGVHAGLQIDPSWPHFRRSINATNDRIRNTLTDYIVQELGERTDLHDKVIPDYPPFAKRMLLDNGWFRTLTRANVQLETGRIERVTPRGIEVSGGLHHDLDAIVFATGFQANRFLWPMQITARGQSLHELWRDDPRAYLGITVPGFPNLFCLYGPNTNLAHGGSIMFHSECQVHYIVECLRLLAQGRQAAMECKQSVHDAYNARVDALHATMVWSHPHVGNWFRNGQGRVTTNSPFRMVDYWAMTREPAEEDFVFTRR